MVKGKEMGQNGEHVDQEAQLGVIYIYVLFILQATKAKSEQIRGFA